MTLTATPGPEWFRIAAGGIADMLESVESILEDDESKRSIKKNSLIFLLEAQSIERSKASRLKKFRVLEKMR